MLTLIWPNFLIWSDLRKKLYLLQKQFFSHIFSYVALKLVTGLSRFFHVAFNVPSKNAVRDVRKSRNLNH